MPSFLKRPILQKRMLESRTQRSKRNGRDNYETDKDEALPSETVSINDNQNSQFSIADLARPRPQDGKTILTIPGSLKTKPAVVAIYTTVTTRDDGLFSGACCGLGLYYF